MIKSQHGLWIAALALGASISAGAAELDKVLDASAAKTTAAAASQQRIDQLADDERQALEEFRHVSKVVEDLKIYNRKLELQVERQQQRLAQIEKSIADVTVIQRRILPLTEDMIGSLENFIALDLPFHQAERSERIAFLNNNLQRPDLTVAEKFRQVLEAYKIESEYGRKIDSYEDVVEIDGSERDVTVLRIGRLALLYQTADMQHAGMWHAGEKRWQPLDSNQYRDAIRYGIRMANRQASTDMLIVPVQAAEGKQ
ncbi:MAG TPA: DUF3450 domain-containing protein [Pseudomonadales bacterium]